MSLLVTPYNPTASVEVLVNAIEAGQRRRTQEQAIIAGLAKAIADDRRHALEWDRVQAFNREKEAEDTRRFEVTRAENTRRYNLENSPVTVPALDNPAPVTTAAVRSEAPTADTSIPGDPSAEILNLDTAGGALPPSRSLLTGEQLDTSPDAMGFQERLAAKRAEQLKQGLAAVEQIGPGAAEASAAQRALELRAQGAAVAGQYPVPTLDGGNIALQQAAPVDPFTHAPPRVPATLPPDGNIAGPLPAATGDQMMDPGPSALIPPGKQVSRYVADLADAGLPVRRKDLAALQRTALASSLRAQRGPGGTPSSAESIDQIVAGLEFNPERGTYKRTDGAEFFVGRSASGKVTLKPFQPDRVKASRWVQGSDGKAYALGSDGQPMQPIPDGVNLQFTPSSEKVFQNSGNTYLLKPGGEPELVVSAAAKVPAGESRDYTKALAERSAAEAELQAKREAQAKKWFSLSTKDVDAAESRLRDAEIVVKTFRERYPQLTGAGKPTPQPPPTEGAPKPGAENTYASAAEVKAAVKAGTLTREQGLAILQSQFGLE